MSKFFKGAISSSDSSDHDSSDNEVLPRTARPTLPDFAYPSDSDDEGQKRVVRAQKDKRFEELKDLIKLAKNSKKIKDMSKLMTIHEDLCKQFEKTRTILNRECLPIPRFYIRHLVELEDFIVEQWEDREARKAMSKGNSKGLIALRQRLRKYNKDFDFEINEYRDEPDPVGYSSGDEIIIENDEHGRFVDDDDDEDEERVMMHKKRAKIVANDEDEQASESDWASEPESSESELSDIEGKQMEDLRKFFLKKEYKESGDKEDDEKARRRKDRKEQKKKEGRHRGEEDEDEDDDGQEWTAIPTKAERARQLFEPKTEINHESVSTKFVEIIAARGKKSTVRKEQVRMMQDLLRISDEKGLGPAMATKILFAIIAGLFELSIKISDFMDYNIWKNVFWDETTPYQVHGSIILVVERIDVEFTKILQNADCHSTDYIEKLKGEKDLCLLIEKAHAYIASRADVYQDGDICKIVIMRIEHLYYKYEEEQVGNCNCNSGTVQMDSLCKMIYSQDHGKRLRQRAILCQIYHHALHDRWHQARDLMLMSHLQATVDHSDISTQILYNRSMCQLGLCAFRHGLIREAHQVLSEIQNTQRSKELLAQGVSQRQQDRTQEQEKQERARQVPYHMHVNVELMECSYLISSMLLEIPLIAAQEYEPRRRMLSRSFHYQLKLSEKSSLVGPPENTREHVVAASRAMLTGDWHKCRDFVINDKMNTKVWKLFRNSEQVQKMVIRRIQEESLRTYLLTYSTVYKTASLDTLADLFDLDKKTVYAIVSKMIIQEELLATFDAPTECLMIHRVEPSRLQLLALQMAEKLALLADNTEQIIEPKTGGRAYTGYAGAGTWTGSQRGPDRKDDRHRPMRPGQYSDRRIQSGRYWNQGGVGFRRTQKRY